MPNDALTLARATHKRMHGTELPMNQTLTTVFAIMDHFVGLHISERDRLMDRIKQLESRHHTITTQGDAA